jgi:hypothetical protein
MDANCGKDLNLFPDECATLSGFNGILGVGLFAQDCGNGCVTKANNMTYYGCNTTDCVGIKVPLAQQVTNPVTALPTDNNGVIIDLPTVNLGGEPNANGYVILGIGTQTNNVANVATSGNANFQAYGADPDVTHTTYGEASTSYKSSPALPAFIDTGSNSLYFPGNFTDCHTVNPAILPGLFCPTVVNSDHAVFVGVTPTPNTSPTINFKIGDFLTLTATASNNVFQEIGGSLIGQFDWGLPFHFGRMVYVGYAPATNLVTVNGNPVPGPLWAF